MAPKRNTMIANLDREFDDETPDEIADILSDSYDLDLARSELKRELEKIQRGGIDINQGVKVLVTAHSTSNSAPWISNIYGVGTVRACRLFEAGYSDIEAIADADIDSLTDVQGISRDFAQVFIEHAQELAGRKESTVEAIAAATTRSKQQIRKDLGSLGASGVPPSKVERFLISYEEQGPPRLTDIGSVDTRIAYFLVQAGFETPEDIASASVTELTNVRYIGDSNVQKIQTSAQEILTNREANTQNLGGGSSHGSQNSMRSATERDDVNRTAQPVDSSYTVACFGGLSPFELVQHPDIGREIIEQIAEEVTTLGVDCVLYTGTQPGGIDTIDMDFSTAVESTVELFSEAGFDVPVGFILGAYDEYGPSIEDLDTRVNKYAAYSSYHQTGFPELPDGLQYVPPDDLVMVGKLPVTQNPRLASDGTVLLMHERRPDQDDESDVLIELSGAGIHGTYTDNCLNTIAVSFDPGLSSDVAFGGYHVLTIDAGSIQTEAFHRLGRVGQLECWDHTAQGRQYIHGPTECPYCANADVTGKTDTADPLPNQQPTETTWVSTLVASSQLELTTGDLSTYFFAHDVLRPAETSPQDNATESTAERELDTEALDAGLLQGEWVLPCSTETVDKTWQQVQKLVAEGQFYDARVSTKLRVSLSDSSKYYLSVAVPNYFDRDDVARVKKVIQNADIDFENLFFKPLIYSKWRVTSETKAAFGLDKTTRYRDLA